ncbi:serine hydrolase domain-containing protein [Candidatus Latescibacterota bacterium]
MIAQMRRLLVALSLLLQTVQLSNGQGLPTAKPEEVGLSTERLERIRPVMEEYIRQNKVVGCITFLARRGKIVHLETAGQMDREASLPMKVDTIFRLASMTKPVTAVAAMILYEEGKFLLSDPVSKYIPEFRDMQVLVPDSSGISHTLVPAKSEITVRQLLNHTSGLTYGGGNLAQYYRNAGVSSGLRSLNGTIGDMVKKLAGLPLNHHPGEKWAYGLSQDVLGYLVEVLSGLPMGRFYHEKIFAPLGMHDTAFYPQKEKADRFAPPYRFAGDTIKRMSADMVTGYLDGPGTYFSGGGGLCSTVSDYARFCQMLLNGGELDGIRLLSRATVDLIRTDSTGGIPILTKADNYRATQGDRYGLGVGIRADIEEMESVGNFGWGGAYHTLAWIDPQEDMFGLFMAQLSGMPDKSQLLKFRIMSYSAIID